MPTPSDSILPDHGPYYKQGYKAVLDADVADPGSTKPKAANGLIISQAFNSLSFIGLTGLTMTYLNLPAGWRFDGRVEKVLSAGTDASKDIYLLW